MMDRRFSGLDRLYGLQQAERIRQAHVAVVGIGGVGSWAAEGLARCGIQRISLIDLDHVAESNINRQIQATEATLGQAKVQAMAERISSYHPQARVRGIEAFASPDNWPQLLAHDGAAEWAQVDAVIDACDQFSAKQHMAVWALRTKTIFICCGAAGGKRLAHQVGVADLAEVTHDPLLAKLRYNLRRNARTNAPTTQQNLEKKEPQKAKRMGLHCVYSPEPVASAHASCAVTESDGSLNCHGYGSSVAVTASMGMAAAGWLVERLALSA